MIRRATTGSLGWVISRLSAQGLEFLAWVLLARRLGAGGVGVLAATAITGRLLGLIGDWGAAFRGPRDVVVAGRGSALISSMVRRREQASSVLAVVMVVGILVSGHPDVAPLAAIVLARGAGRDWIALGEGRRRDASMPLLLQSAIILAAVSMTSSVGAAALGISIGNLAGLALGVRLNPVVRRSAVPTVAVDAWYLLAGIADQILVSADTALLLWLRSAEEAGIYTSAYRLPLAWVTVVGLCTAAAIPVIAGRVAAGKTDAARLHRGADRLALMGAVLVLPVAIVGVALLGPIFGSEFALGHDALVVLFVASAATTASAPYRALYTTFGPDRLVGIVTGFVASGNVVGNLLVIGRWGMLGAAATTLISQVGMLGYFVLWSMHHRRTVTDQAGDQWSSARIPSLVDMNVERTELA